LCPMGFYRACFPRLASGNTGKQASTHNSLSRTILKGGHPMTRHTHAADHPSSRPRWCGIQREKMLKGGCCSTFRLALEPIVRIGGPVSSISSLKRRSSFKNTFFSWSHYEKWRWSPPHIAAGCPPIRGARSDFRSRTGRDRWRVFE
jgi:hypothetical protein